MKKFFSLVLALVMALSLTTVAWGAITTWPAGTTANGVTTIDLADDVNLTTPVEITTNTIINGNGKTLTVSHAQAIIVKGADVKLTINNLNIVANNNAIRVLEDATNAEISISGSNLTGLSTVNVRAPGATLTIDGGKVTCDDQTDLENYGALTIAPSGVGATITTTGVTFDIKGDSMVALNVATNGEIIVNSSSAAVNTHVAYIDFGSGGIYSFATVNAAIEYAVTEMGADENNPVEITVTEYAVNSGESFPETEGVELTMPAGAELVDDGTGNMTVAPAGTSGGAVATKFYVADDAAADDWKLLASFPGDDLSDFAKDSSDNFLPCYEVPNYGFFTEVKAANGAYKLTYGAAKVVYLAPVDYSDVHYDYKATALTVVDEDDAECGDWFVTGLDEDDKYYAAYTKKGEVEGVFVAEKNGSMQILVGGKIVDVEWQDIGTDVEWKLHQFKGYDVVNGEYTTVKCENCPKVAKLYANATAATIGKKEPVKLPNNLGWVTLADFFDFGAVAGGSVSTDKDDKVTSADTFDAGIAMYVGMSVMAAAGSAVVLKKKD